MNDSYSISPVPEFKDRSMGLVVFGIIEILLGCLCALLVPLMLLGQAMSARMTGGAPNYRMAVPGVIMYGILAVTFIWLGIGSIRCRRWARALVLILSWSWLLSGVVALGFLVFFLPNMMEGLPTAAAKIVGLVVAGGMLVIIFIVLPGSLVIFYQSKHVKATCEHRDPVPRWTDACPTPVLTLSLCLGFGAVMILPMLLGNNCVMPCFGLLLSGLPGTLIYLLLTALCAYLAWGVYRLKPAAWWITLAALVLLVVSSILTFTQVDLMDMYRLMGYPKEQIEQIQKFNFINSKTMVWCSACFFPPFFGYLLWIKKFFRPAVSAP